jgi:heme exporter protein D
MSHEPIASPWIVFPIAAILLIAVAGHLIALREVPAGKIPESRRRIRIATGWVIMFTIPLSAYGFGIANTSEPNIFAFVWTAVVLLVGCILLLAMIDMLNSARINRGEQDELNRELGRILRGEPEEHGDD